LDSPNRPRMAEVTSSSLVGSTLKSPYLLVKRYLDSTGRGDFCPFDGDRTVTKANALQPLRTDRSVNDEIQTKAPVASCNVRLMWDWVRCYAVAPVCHLLSPGDQVLESRVPPIIQTQDAYVGCSHHLEDGLAQEI